MQGGRGQVNGGDRYSIELRYSGKRRTITRSKLVYMIVKRRCVPSGYVVHHNDLDRHNDGACNLRAYSEAYHSIIHGNNPYDY